MYLKKIHGNQQNICFHFFFCGRHVHILGSYANIRIAKDAIARLILGTFRILLLLFMYCVLYLCCVFLVFRSAFLSLFMYFVLCSYFLVGECVIPALFHKIGVAPATGLSHPHACSYVAAFSVFSSSTSSHYSSSSNIVVAQTCSGGL
jgi:hypothetical protein